MKNVKINITGGELRDEEIQAYVDRGREQKPSQKLIGLDINVDGEYVDLTLLVLSTASTTQKRRRYWTE